MTHLIRANHFHNQYDNLVKSLGEFDWDNICEFFTEHQSKPKKEEVALFNFVRYREVDADQPNDNTGFLANTGQPVPLRRKINLIQVDALVLDYDGGMTIDDAKHHFADYEYLAYTSYSHLKDGKTHKFRLILPLAVPIPVNPRFDTLPTYDDLEIPLGHFAGECDPVVFNPNQIYYVPATHPDRIHLASSWVNHGKILDWRTWEIPEPLDMPVDYSNPNRPVVARGNNHRLDPEIEFITVEGIVKAKDVLKTYQKVRCPFHEDKSGSEFLKKFDDSGVVYFRCKHCGGFSLHPTEINEPPKLNTLPNAVTEDFIFDDADYYLDHQTVDRTKIQQALKKISSKITNDITYDRITGQPSSPKAHIVYLPEGAGKSQLAVNIVKRGYPVVFACQTWNQAYEKQQEFQEKLRSDDPEKHINVVISHSFESRFRLKWKFETIRVGSNRGYKTREIDKEATINKIMAEYPRLSRKYIELWWELFNKSPEKISHAMSKAMEDYELMSVSHDDDTGIVIDEWFEQNKHTGMVVTTFSQLRLLRTRQDSLPRDYLIWFDDPGLDDVANISPIEDEPNDANTDSTDSLPDSSLGLPELTQALEKSHGYSNEEVLEIIGQINGDDNDWLPSKPVKTREIQGVTYHLRAESQSLGCSTLRHRMVFTTTELLTKQALTQHLCHLWKVPVIHELMEKVPFGRITLLGTNKVRRRQDAMIPVILRILEKKNIPVQLIADGLGSNYNHVNSKGVNTLADTDILVEVSVPHPTEVKKVCAILGLEVKTHQREITLNLMLDKIHQAVGRNSGYRWKWKECVVLVDKGYHAEIVDKIRYNVDPINSVVIDRTRTMALTEKRIAPSASPLTTQIEKYLNHIDQLIDDRRTITHAIDHVIKQIEDREKQIRYIARLLTAISTFSNTRLENPANDLKPEPHRLNNFLLVWEHIQTKWINDSNRTRIMNQYESNMKNPD